MATSESKVRIFVRYACGVRWAKIVSYAPPANADPELVKDVVIFTSIELVAERHEASQFSERGVAWVRGFLPAFFVEPC